MDSAPQKVKANAYDIVLNGVELGGGSIRIHDRDLQSKMFDILGLTQEECEEKFGFLIEALSPERLLTEDWHTALTGL